MTFKLGFDRKLRQSDYCNRDVIIIRFIHFACYLHPVGLAKNQYTVKFAVLNVCKSHGSQVKIFAELNLVISAVCLNTEYQRFLLF